MNDFDSLYVKTEKLTMGESVGTIPDHLDTRKKLRVCWTVALDHEMNIAEKNAFYQACVTAFYAFRDDVQPGWADLINEWKVTFQTTLKAYTALYEKLAESTFSAHTPVKTEPTLLDRLVFRVVQYQVKEHEAAEKLEYALRICTVEECDEEQHPLLDKFVSHYMYVHNDNLDTSGPFAIRRWDFIPSEKELGISLFELGARQVYIDWRFACAICHFPVMEHDVPRHSAMHCVHPDADDIIHHVAYLKRAAQITHTHEIIRDTADLAREHADGERENGALYELISL